MEELGAYSNVGTLVMLSALLLYKFIKHSSCKSKCFGQENSMKIDLSALPSETKLDEKLMSVSPSSPESPRPAEGGLVPRPRIYV